MKDKGQTPDDISLWQYAMRDVKRLFWPDTADAGSLAAKPPKRTALSEVSLPRFALKQPEKPAEEIGSGLDRRTEERFRKGRMPIEGRLDLHGLTQREAYPAVIDFIRHQHASAKRCVLVITGKGLKNEGALRRNLQHWLDAPELRNMILSISIAQPHHGGSGAFYILLRRQR